METKEQAEQCVRTGYIVKTAARDAILHQTDDKNLIKKITSKYLSFSDTVKYSLAMEQGARKVEQIVG